MPWLGKFNPRCSLPEHGVVLCSADVDKGSTWEKVWGRNGGGDGCETLEVKVICCDQNVRFMCMSDEMGTWVEANEIKEDDLIQL